MNYYTLYLIKKHWHKLKFLHEDCQHRQELLQDKLVFFADDAAKWHEDGHKVIMVRIETSPEDLAGMNAAEGILTARGGMTSHAAVVARGMGKCCVSGAGGVTVNYKKRTVEIDGTVLHEGDYLSLNGSTGEVYYGEVQTKAAEVTGDFAQLMDLCNKYTKLRVRTKCRYTTRCRSSTYILEQLV